MFSMTHRPGRTSFSSYSSFIPRLRTTMQVNNGQGPETKVPQRAASEPYTGPISFGAVNSAGTESNRGSVIPRTVPAWRALFPSELG